MTETRVYFVRKESPVTGIFCSDRGVESPYLLQTADFIELAEMQGGVTSLDRFLDDISAKHFNTDEYIFRYKEVECT